MTIFRDVIFNQIFVDKAQLMAVTAHRAVGQVRKYTGAPYEEHCARVAGLVMQAPILDSKLHAQMVAAAWLHDVVEDTQVPLGIIVDYFGEDVGAMVEALTDLPRSDGNRAFRKQDAVRRLTAASGGAQSVKCADIADNVCDIAEHDPNFGRVCVPEMKAMLTALTRADHYLFGVAFDEVAKAEKLLSM